MSDLLQKILENKSFSKADKLLIQKAYNTAELAHRGQKRLSGEEYITHPLQAAYFLSELGMDATTIAACLLHDTLEDTNLKPEDIKREFGQEILFLVEAGIAQPPQQRQKNRREISCFSLYSAIIERFQPRTFKHYIFLLFRNIIICFLQGNTKYLNL